MARKKKKRYTYNGAVMLWDELYESHWNATTFAVTERSARNNLTYRYKTLRGMLPTEKVTLPGKLTKSE